MNMEQKTNAQRFITVYNELDHFMDQKLHGDKRFGSYYQRIMELSRRDNTFKKHRMTLHSFGELRNAIVHDYGRNQMEVIAEPHLKQVELFEAIYEEVTNPPEALAHIAIKAQLLYSVTEEVEVSKVMDVMEKRSFFYVPILVKGKLEGVFSEESIFRYLKDHGKMILGPEITMKTLSAYTKVEAHRKEAFQFAGKEESVADLEERLKNSATNNKRLEVVFITENGQQDGTLLGMVTLWDLVKE